MSKQELPERLTLHDPVTYEILAQGALDPSWNHEFGMEISQSYGEHGVITRLFGRLRDQAALAGVLQRLYGLGYPLLQVSWMAEALPAPGQGLAQPNDER